ncbi:MAG: hypothetical protein OXF75_04810 [Acidimicrobiaceae bacterium]|nr:hypothetical protein [Acidimicrobiaceae bacterium]
MPNRRWTEYLASLGLLGTEFGKAIEGVVGVPVTAHSAFEAAVKAASMALEGRRIQSTAHDDSSATLGRVVEAVPSFALPVMAAGRIAVWQRLALELADGSWQGYGFDRALVTAHDVGLDSNRLDQINVGRLTAEVETPVTELRRWLELRELDTKVEIVDGVFVIRPGWSSRLTSSGNGPELHNQRVYLHVVSAGLWGRTSSRVAGLPLALSFSVDEAPPDLSVTDFAIEGDTVRARLTRTDLVVPVDLREVLAAAGAEGAGAAAALLALLTNVSP